jgi:hypothetical protein
MTPSQVRGITAYGKIELKCAICDQLQDPTLKFVVGGLVPFAIGNHSSSSTEVKSVCG